MTSGGSKDEARAGRPAGPSRRRLKWAIPLLLAVTVAGVWSSCGDDGEVNVFRPAAKPLALRANDDAKAEEARVKMDDGDYDGAVEQLEPMLEEDGSDSNEARVLYAAARVGAAGLDVWTVIRELLSTQEKQRGGGGGRKSGGVVAVIDSLTDSDLGTGAERAEKVDALSDAIMALLAAPEPESRDVKATSCLLAAMLAVPALADLTSGTSATLSAMAQIRDAVTGDGSECPNVGLMDQGLATVIGASASFNLILEAATGCPFLDLGEASGAMNRIQTQLAAMKAGADKGCSATPTCSASLPNCQTLLPTCVQQVLGSGAVATAGDGKLAACELVLNCGLGGGCI
jgi:hypothetical protein